MKENNVDAKYGGYDGGLTDEYEDDVPKKRGRKKKSATAADKSHEQNDSVLVVSADNDELIDALINGEEVSSEELDNAFAQYSPGVDLCCDTTGTIGKLRTRLPKENSIAGIDANDEQTAARFVIKWCNRMMRKDDYTDDENDAFETMKELLARLGEDDEPML